MSHNYVTVHVTGTSALDITVARTPQIPVVTWPRGVGRGRALGAGAPPSSAKATLRAPPSLMTVFSLGITGID